MMGLVAGAGGTGPALEFDGERAFFDLRALVAIGPRPAGSDGSRDARALIRSRLRQAGWPVREHSFEVTPEDRSPVRMTNLIAELPGERPEWILFGTHYDTKQVAGIRFVGANDGASGAALLLELARQLGPVERPYGVRLLFFDGEEPFGPRMSLDDGLYGSQALAEEMEGTGELVYVRALIVVDMVADSDLDLVEDRDSSPRLRRLARAAAAHIGAESVLDRGPQAVILDDHVPFRERGLEEVLCLIDLRYGDRTMPGPFWHTARDSLNAVSVESLNTVGRIVVELYVRLTRELERG
jgi:Zn-dependent M28 family amino/carboxypeptidase